MAWQHPYRTQQVVCWMPIGWLGDYAGRSAGVVLCSRTEAIFKASNHEPYTRQIPGGCRGGLQY